jgi:hypothetical protein
MEAVAVLIPTGFFLMVGFIVWSIARSKSRTAEMQAQVQARLIDRFSSAPEFVDFLHSPEGKQLLGGVDTIPKLHATDNILRGIRTGIITTFLGLGFLGLCLSEEVRNEGFLIAGAVLTAIGIGNFISTYVSVRLSRQWGLMPGKTNAEESTRDLSQANS